MISGNADHPSMHYHQACFLLSFSFTLPLGLEQNFGLIQGAAPPVQAAQLAEALQKDFHYTVDEKQRSILLTEDGYEAAEDVLQARGVLLCAPMSGPVCTDTLKP